MTVNFVPHSPLTQSDITRMPKSMATVGNTSNLVAADSYSSKKKSSFLGKVIKTVIFAAAASVLLKRFGGSFMKVADSANMGTLDKIKTGILKFADKVETPFIKGYQALTKLFKGKGAAASAAAEKAAGTV